MLPQLHVRKCAKKAIVWKHFLGMCDIWFCPQNREASPHSGSWLKSSVGASETGSSPGVWARQPKQRWFSATRSAIDYDTRGSSSNWRSLFCPLDYIICGRKRCLFHSLCPRASPACSQHSSNAESCHRVAQERITAKRLSTTVKRQSVLTSELSVPSSWMHSG